jgi:hypothetical protein
MENKQEKLFDDKRIAVEPKYVSIDEWVPEKLNSSLIQDIQNSVYASLQSSYRGGLTYTDPRTLKIDADSDTETEEWIWVDGYKATNAYMQCKGYQYEMDKQHDMSDDAVIRDCESGFHFCRDLDDVFTYYGVNNGNRFFQVRSLVRKKDFEEYGKYGHPWTRRRDKLAAKSIVFVRELTNDEVLKGTDAENWSEEDKNIARIHSVQFVKDRNNAAKLVTLGYSEAFAKYIVGEGHFEAAYAAGTQEGLSMDMKVACIMANEC